MVAILEGCKERIPSIDLNVRFRRVAKWCELQARLLWKFYQVEMRAIAVFDR